MGTSADLDEPEVRLLGPVEVVGGHPVALAPRERALLARLAIDAGRTVTVDRLVDDLWVGDPPASARNALQVYASRLRARIEGSRLLGTSMTKRMLCFRRPATLPASAPAPK